MTIAGKALADSSVRGIDIAIPSAVPYPLGCSCLGGTTEIDFTSARSFSGTGSSPSGSAPNAACTAAASPVASRPTTSGTTSRLCRRSQPVIRSGSPPGRSWTTTSRCCPADAIHRCIARHPCPPRYQRIPDPCHRRVTTLSLLVAGALLPGRPPDEPADIPGGSFGSLAAQYLGEFVGRGAVEVVAAAVVAAGGARVGGAEGVLDVLQRHAAGQRLGGEGVPEGVRLGQLGRGDAGGAGQAAQLGVHAAVGVAGGAVVVEEDRPAGALADQRIQGADRRRRQHDGGDRAALAADAQPRWPWSVR